MFFLPMKFPQILQLISIVFPKWVQVESISSTTPYVFHRDRLLSTSTTAFCNSTRSLTTHHFASVSCNASVRMLRSDPAPANVESAPRFSVPYPANVDDHGTFLGNHGCYLCVCKRRESWTALEDHARLPDFGSFKTFCERKRFVFLILPSVMRTYLQQRTQREKQNHRMSTWTSL